MNPQRRRKHMNAILEFVFKHGYAILFAALFAHQLGLPLPGPLFLLAAGAVAAAGRLGFVPALALAVTACVLADWPWYEAGRYRGDKVLHFLHRLTRDPDYHDRKAKETFARYGPPILLVSKFGPGLDAVTPPLAGTSRTGRLRFLAFDASGAALYSFTYAGLGYVFRNDLNRAAAYAGRVGSALSLLALTGISIVATRHLLRRRQFLIDLKRAGALMQEAVVSTKRRIASTSAATGIRKAVVLGLLFMMTARLSAQTTSQQLTLAIQGCSGEVSVAQVDGRVLVDVRDLVRMTNGSARLEADRVVVTLPCAGRMQQADADSSSRFSRPFMRAAIEAMASVREWGGTLLVAVQNGYPVGNTMAGNAIVAYEGRAADSVALASAAASTDADRRGLELLQNELDHAHAWADAVIKARNAMSAANLSMNPTALANDEEYQKLDHCGQFLAHMFAGGTFQDDGSCR